MKRNIGKTDKGVRVLLGLIIILAGIAFKSWYGLAGLVLLVTAFINWCPLYAIFGIRSNRAKKDS